VVDSGVGLAGRGVRGGSSRGGRELDKLSLEGRDVLAGRLEVGTGLAGMLLGGIELVADAAFEGRCCLGRTALTCDGEEEDAV
jgi:hypothetical protein